MFWKKPKIQTPQPEIPYLLKQEFDISYWPVVIGLRYYLQPGDYILKERGIASQLIPGRFFSTIILSKEANDFRDFLYREWSRASNVDWSSIPDHFIYMLSVHLRGYLDWGGEDYPLLYAGPHFGGAPFICAGQEKYILEHLQDLDRYHMILELEKQYFAWKKENQ